MKAIIDGRLYDTEKSEEIARTSSAQGSAQDSAFGFGMGRITESLYRSPNFGQLFVAREEYEVMAGTKSSMYLIGDVEEAVEWLADHGIVNIEAYRALGVEIEEA